MTNITFKQRVSLPSRTQGAATLVVTLILIVTATLIIIFAADHGRTIDKMTANQNRYNQAYEAAEAGLEMGIVYLQQNSATILASPSNGYIQNYTSTSTTNVSLANGARYSIVYTNPNANNYNLIKITSTGTSDDSTSTRSVSQLVEFDSILANAPTNPIVSKGSVAMSGNSTVSNTTSSATIKSASSVTIGGSAQTVLSSGVSSSAGFIGCDIQQNNSTLSSQSQNDFFATYFGVPTNTVQNTSTYYYSNTLSTNYSSSLNGLTGTSIWIDQISGSATLNGNATIGSASHPVLLIVNGDLDISGNVQIYGLVFVIGSTFAQTDITGNVSITGGLISTDNLSMSGSTNIAFNPTVLSNLRNESNLSYYAKVPGSWKDF